MTSRPAILLVLGVLAAGTGACHGPDDAERAAAPSPRVSALHAYSFAEVPVEALRTTPDAHVGKVFEERFTFQRIWWGRERARPGEQSLDIPTHATARITAAPLYIARIEFPPAADPVFEHFGKGQEVRLRVRFLRLHAASRSPVFLFEDVLPSGGVERDLQRMGRP